MQGHGFGWLDSSAGPRPEGCIPPKSPSGRHVENRPDHSTGAVLVQRLASYSPNIRGPQVARCAFPPERWAEASRVVRQYAAANRLVALWGKRGRSKG